MVTLAEAYAAQDVAMPKKRRRRPEWTLQTKIKAFVREFVACEHEFVAHDRSFDKTGMQHLFEEQRGIRRAWMDTSLAIMGGCTFRCELKFPPNKVVAGDDQHKLIARMNKLGHPTAWTDNVEGYMVAAMAAGVPFRPGALARARYLDEWLRATFAKRSAARKKGGAGAPPRPSKGALRVAAQAQRAK
jgi:hypothetical protein